MLKSNAGVAIKDIELSPLYTQQLNGRAERFIRTMDEKGACMRHQAGTPNSWWEFAIEYAVHIYNRTPLQRHKWKTPYEILEGTVPKIDHLRVFGCGAYVFVPSETRANKMAPKVELMTFIGYGSSGYKFITRTGAVRQQPHALFDKMYFPRLKDTERPQTITPFYEIKEIDIEDDQDETPYLPVGTGAAPPAQVPPTSPVQKPENDSPDGDSESISAPALRRVSSLPMPVASTPWSVRLHENSPPPHERRKHIQQIPVEEDSPGLPIALQKEARNRKDVKKDSNTLPLAALDNDEAWRKAVNDDEPMTKPRAPKAQPKSRVPVPSPGPSAPSTPTVPALAAITPRSPIT
jgi:hypothetical protein